MQEYAENKELMSQPQRIVISRFEVTNGTIKSPLPIPNLELGFISTKTYCFVEYNIVKYLSIFVESAVVARRQKDENPNSGVVAETLKLLPTAVEAIKLRIAFAIQLQVVEMMKRHMQQIAK